MLHGVNRAMGCYNRKCNDAMEVYHPMNLLEYAANELKAFNLDEEYAYGTMINTAVMELMQTFSQQGHSGGSASVVLGLFQKLAAYQPLSPLTGADDEWMPIDESIGGPTMMFQNKRAHSVFKGADGKAYDIDAVVYHDVTNGSYFHKGGEYHYIQFPYTPSQTIIPVDADGNPITQPTPLTSVA